MSDQGTVELYRRIAAAARRVCPGEDSRDLGVQVAARRCAAEAIARAVRDVSSPQLAALEAAHGRRAKHG